MASPTSALVALLQSAMARRFGESFAGGDPVLRPSDHADFQANAAMKLAKGVGMSPRDFASALAEELAGAEELAAVEVAGPGFLNLTLSDQWIASLVSRAAASERLGVEAAAAAATVVVDYSSPNVAKEMHVGHLRSTVIGDSLVRLLGFLGHRVIRQNHLGDWGTQFGMLIEHLLDSGLAGAEIADLNALYQEAKRRFDADDSGFASRARERVVRLQAGDAETLSLWQSLVAESQRHFEQVYGLLGVSLSRDDTRGESFYNDQLASVVSELDALGLTKLDDGAVCVFPPGFAGRDGDALPLIVQKSDGGFGYAATDLAGVRFRVQDLGADWIVYVVDARQSQHLSMVFSVAEMAGWLGGETGRRAEHVSFGTVLGPDNRPFKTRSGETVRLLDLLEEAIQRATDVVEEKSGALPAEEKDAVARAVGVGAVKYADLSSDRVKDYVFDWNRMLSMAGNTAPYMQYAHARVRSILRRDEAVGAVSTSVLLTHPAERALALSLLGLEDAVRSAADHLQPHRLCTYLFDLADTFTGFYEHCPVLKAESEELKGSRLALCELTARTLEVGLGLLGISAPERM